MRDLGALVSFAIMPQRLDTKMVSIKTDNAAAMASLPQKVDIHTHEAQARFSITRSRPGPLPLLPR
jgi:hypothetical protein